MAPSVIETEKSPQTGGEREARKRWIRLDGCGATIGSLGPFRLATVKPSQGPLKQLRLPQEGARTLKVRYCSYFTFASECGCLYRPGYVRLDRRRLNNTSLLHPERKEEKRRSAELGNTKETLRVPTSLNNFPTTAVAPYWINQRLQSKMYNQTPSLHRNERHR